MLYEFVAVNRDEIILRCRAKVATRSVPPPTDAEIHHAVPLLLDQLVAALRLGRSSTREIDRGALPHGHDLLLQGLTLSQVVHDYGDVCQSVTELAAEKNVPVGADDFRILNGYLDIAIASAVTQYGSERHQSALDDASARANERLGFFAHELRNLLHTAMIAFEVVKSGNVGIAGSTGAVLHRSLVRARDLTARSLAEVRLTQGVQDRKPFLVSEFIEELAVDARLDANLRGLRLTVLPVEAGVAIEADRQVLAAVIGNLLQNAFKFTRPRTIVTLRVRTTADRVSIEVEDECGGLPAGNVNDLFRPFEQRSADRTGLGLGLAFSRWAAEANHGRISTVNLPDRGCIFAVDLPRCLVSAALTTGTSD